ncbi:MAG TPA: ASKHA domain-containing protein [Methylomusa anaerophila]|uniref:2Fe-2S ferredoxin n=1 Tax=Methylomusa anaerophila TaxID=1930071 RepID=A0A348AFJ2_9FIRM|nr:ASKHA domain-containing protein [Methylomusa anaerophila]BBB89840.1 2Fe-2S ferredoxin [Methylomusa anaerophila]HML89114.1 ASKHA domain-containing protein [Methylomusa anaerophila]
MDTRSVTFLPAGVKVAVEPGIDLLTAAGKANIEIKAPCGGDGTCGKCAVIIKSGKAKARRESYLATRLAEKGLNLACQSLVEDEDLVVEIPKISAMGKHQVLVENVALGEGVSDALREYLLNVWQLKDLFKQKHEDPLHGYPLNPLCRWVQLTMPAASLQDNRDDLSRLVLSLRKETKCTDINIPLSLLRKLGDTIRVENFKISILLSEVGGKAEVIAIEPGHRHQPLYGIAVDIGTTTVVAYLLDLRKGTIVDTAGTHNRQARFGDDVISRIVYAVDEPDGMKDVHQSIIDTINTLIQDLLVKQRKINEADIRVMMTAGNTTMAHLFLGINPQYIRLEPYIPTANFFPVVKAQELGIRVHPDAPVFCFPAVASYVGGDIVSGTLFTAMGKADAQVSLLIDIGTNGEMVLGAGDWLVTCSCSAGPAFEGSGITFGMRAMHGAIEHMQINPETYEVSYATINNGRPLGICGTGLIDGLAKLRRTGIIDRAGKFQTHLPTPRMRIGEVGPEFVLVWAADTEIDRDIVISEADVKNLLRAKGAVFAGIRTLLNVVGFEFGSIETVYVAGGFGNYLNIPDAIAIGLLPDLPVEKYKFIGNSSAKGACMALLSAEAWAEAQDVAGKMTYIELSVGNMFMDEFISSLFIPHTDLTLFPNVDL